MISKPLKCCLLFLLTSMLASCASTDKQERIISVQKRRIINLQKQIKRQDNLLAKLKSKEWAKVSKKNQKRRKFRGDMAKLDQLIKNRQWVKALRHSANLKQVYPKALSVRRRRVKIFNRMGLKKQANTELINLQKLQSKKKKIKRKRKI